MQNGKGLVTGFVAGLAVAAGAFFLLRDEPAMPASEDARIAALAAQVDRIERGVSRLAKPAAGEPRVVQEEAAVPTALPPVEGSRSVQELQKVIVSADGMVDQAIQMGQWTRLQARELAELTADLPADERDRIMARVAAAINNDQVQPELP